MLCYAKSLQSCPALCDPIDGSLPGSPVPGILQARTLEWVAISFSNAWKWKVKVKSLSRVRLLAAYQAPPSMGFSRQEYWSGVPLPSLLKHHNYHEFPWYRKPVRPETVWNWCQCWPYPKSTQNQHKEMSSNNKIIQSYNKQKIYKKQLVIQSIGIEMLFSQSNKYHGTDRWEFEFHFALE